MRKLVIIVSSLTLVVILLMSMSMPVMAAKSEEKNDNKPVAWVTASINTGAFMEEHARHSITVKLLTDGSTVGHLNGQTGVNITHSVGFWQGRTYFWTWNDEDTQVKMADFIEFVYSTEYEMNLAIRFQIADYGEPGKNDWHRAWIWLGYHPVTGAEVWMPLFDGYLVAYDNGNAKIHGTMGDPPDDWDETAMLPEIYHWK
ncbi:MAG TPA: hypothetical protein G4O15_14790 [Dehalococcoidia bacterium]|nr:hypothetical protein [Dehalococcoidia bacterium]